MSLALVSYARRGGASVGQRWSATTLWKRIFLLAGGVIVAVFVTAVVAPQLFTSSSPSALYASGPMAAPSFAHPMGTDELGRDYFARVVYGARASLTMSMLVVAIGASVGLLIGICSGLAGGWLDDVLMRIVDLFLSLPGFVLALALSAALGRGEVAVVIALAVVWWPSYARVFRGMILGMKHRLHVEGARAMGASPGWIARKHILPFLWGQLNVRVSQDMGYALVSVAGLGFLGLGAQPPTPEWGALLEAGLQYIVNGWWLTFFPGLAITIWTVGVAMLGDGIASFAGAERSGR